jgi:hypothetical protein
MEQDPVGVFVSVHFHRRFPFHKRSQLFLLQRTEGLRDYLIFLESSMFLKKFVEHQRV